MTELIELRTLADLDAWHLTWTHLAGQMRGGGYGSTLAAWRSFVEHAPHGFRAWVVRAQGETLGIVALGRDAPTPGEPRACWSNAPRGGAVPMNAIRGAVVGRQPMATLAALGRHWLETSFPLTELELRGIDRGGAEWTALEALARHQGWRHTHHTTEHVRLTSRGVWFDVWSSLPTTFRLGIENEERTLRKLGVLDRERDRPRGRVWGEDEPDWELWEMAEGLIPPEGRAAWDRLALGHAAAAAQGGADLNVLTLAGRPVALLYALGHGRQWSVVCESSAPERGWASELLVREVLADASARGEGIEYEFPRDARHDWSAWPVESVERGQIMFESRPTWVGRTWTWPGWLQPTRVE